MDHTNCLQVAIKTIQFNARFFVAKTAISPPAALWGGVSMLPVQ
jgi:hypothetical protein